MSAERMWFVAQYQESRYRPYLSAYLETAMVPGFKTTVTVWGITGEREQRERRFFLPDRAGALADVERRIRARGAFVTVVFARQF